MPGEHENEIWNPWTALFLSLIFTPVFGAMLHKTDLRRVGEKEESALAFGWEKASLILLVAAAVLQPVAAEREGWGLLILAVDLSLLAAWGAACGVRHARLISRKAASCQDFVQVSVSRAVTLGLFGMLAWVVIFKIAGILWTLAGVTAG